MKALIAQLVASAAELHTIGAVRPEHAERFAGVRVQLDQAAELADQAAPAPAPVDVQLATLATAVAAVHAAVVEVRELVAPAA